MNNIQFNQELFGRLAPREIEIVKAASEGLSIKESMERFGVKRSTIAKHRARIIFKLSCKNISGAVGMLKDAGII